MRYITSEAVLQGHPDKVADQIADALLDAYLVQDPEARVACEVLISKGLLVVSGEITSDADVDIQKIALDCVAEIGYDLHELGLENPLQSFIIGVNQQSSDISHGIGERFCPIGDLGAGDSGIISGYATNETQEYLPLSFVLATQLAHSLTQARRLNILPFLRPDGKVQVTVSYHLDGTPSHIDCVVISCQHRTNISLEKLRQSLTSFVTENLPKTLLNNSTRIIVNSGGCFTIGGPLADTGLTGRKQIVDTYGGAARHYGGAFSGKDPTKIDRSGAYAARYIAKQIVAAGIVPKIEVQLAYAIGCSEPIALAIDTFGYFKNEELIIQTIKKLFPLSVGNIIERFNLRRPIYRLTAWGGHFGRVGNTFTWENLDNVLALRRELF